MVIGFGYITCQERLRDLRSYNFKKKRLKEHLIVVFKYLMSVYKIDIIKGLEYLSYEERLGKRRLRRYLIKAFKCLQGRHQEDVALFRALFSGAQGQDKDK